MFIFYLLKKTFYVSFSKTFKIIYPHFFFLHKNAVLGERFFCFLPFGSAEDPTQGPYTLGSSSTTELYLSPVGEHGTHPLSFYGRWHTLIHAVGDWCKGMSSGPSWTTQ